MQQFYIKETLILIREKQTKMSLHAEETSKSFDTQQDKSGTHQRTLTEKIQGMQDQNAKKHQKKRHLIRLMTPGNRQ